MCARRREAFEKKTPKRWHGSNCNWRNRTLRYFNRNMLEGKLNLREVEKARLSENERWMAYLDANFARQQAQLELLRVAGQLNKVWQ